MIGSLAGLSMVVQAGGESRRMGQDKALVALRGEPLVVRQLRRLGGLGEEVVVTTNRPEAYAFLGVRLETDRIPGRGALGGLYTALSVATQPLVAVVACDMPFASLELFRLGWELLQEDRWDAVIPRSPEGSEPFHTVYRRQTCTPLVEAAIQAGLWRVDSWFPGARLRWLEEKEIRSVDSSGLAFWNINSPEDLQQAESLAAVHDRG